MPWRAISIMPLLMMAPMKTPIAATAMTVLNDAARAPIADDRKFTASLLTPAVRSKMASRNRNTTKPRKTRSIAEC